MVAASFELREVSLSYGSLSALEGIDLRIRPGERVAFVGPSGAGKTSLLRLLNGSLRPTEGSVEVSGTALSELSESQLRQLRSRIAFVHQHLDLVPNLRVVKNVLLGRLGRLSLPASLKVMLLPSRALVGEVHEVLERVGIPEKLYQRTDSLSGGQKQRVAVARALFQQPAALLADEPVSAVDPARARETVRLLTEISREESLTLAVSLHNFELARDCFPRMVGLRHGRVVFDRAPAEVDEADFEELYELDGRGLGNGGFDHGRNP